MPLTPDEYLKRYGVSGSSTSDYNTRAEAGWGAKFGAAVDTAQAGLWGVGEAMGSDWAREQRIANEVEARGTADVANRNLDIAGSFKEAKGLGGVGRYVGGLLVDSAPQMAATLAAGAVGGLPGALATGYGFALGDTLQNQREQSGRTDLLTAGAAAVPYAAVDVLTGAEGRLLRNVGGKAGKQMLEEAPGVITRAADRVGGLKGTAARWGLQTGKTGIEEAAGESFQEVMNQAARMGVDRHADLLDPEALERYRESAIGGGLMGGAIGGVNLGRRSAGADQIGDKADPDASTTEEWSATPGSKRAQRQSEARAGFDPLHRAATFQGPERPAGFQPPPPGVPPGAPGGGPGAPSQPSVPPGSSTVPQAVKQVNDTFGIPVAAAVAAQQPASPQDAAQQDHWQTIKAKAQKFQQMEANAVADGVDPKYLPQYMKLGEALDQGAIDQQTYTASVAALASGNKALISEVTKALNAAKKPAAAPAAPAIPPAPATAALPNAGAAPVTTAAAPAPATAAPAPATAAPAPAAAAPAPAAAAAPLPADTTPGMRAIAPFTNATGQPIAGQARERLFTLLGLDEDGNPVGDRMTMEEVAEVESRVRGAGATPVSKQAIQKMLAPFNLDEAAIDALYDQIHGGAHGMEGTVHIQGAGLEDEDVRMEAPERAKVTDTDRSEQAGAFDTRETGEAGSMRLVESANQNIAVEEVSSEQRKKILRDLLKNTEYNEEQKAAIEKALKSKNHEVGGLLKSKAFSDEQRTVLETLFEHGKTTVAQAKRRAVVDAEVNRRLGVQTEHDKQVRERIAAENAVRMAREEQQKLERQAAAEDNMAGADEAVDEDGRTLRMRLMDPNKIRQERLIGESLVDAKQTWGELVDEFNKGKDAAFPVWGELSIDEQAAFVRAVDTFNYPPAELASVPEHRAQKIMEDTAFEIGNTAIKRKADTAKRAEREAVAAKPEFQRLAREQRDREEAAERDRIKAEADARKEQRAKEAADRKAAKEKTDAQAQGASGPVGQPAGQTVQRSGTGEAGGQVPEGGAGGAAAPVVREGPEAQGVRAEDAGAAQAEAEQGSDSDVAGANQIETVLREASQVAPIEGGIQLHNERWVHKDHAIEAALLGMSAREQAMPFQFYRILGIAPAYWDTMVAAMREVTESPKFKSIVALQEAREESPAPLTVTAPAGALPEGAGRTPSVTRTVRTAAAQLEDGLMTPDTFVAVTTAALDAADAARVRKPVLGRVRGADRVMEALLAGRRRGELDHEGVEMAMWFIRQNPALVDDLAISVRAAGQNERNTAGSYNPVTRIMTLMKGGTHTDTAVHEILHHLERMMPPAMQAAIRRAWSRRLAKAYKDAVKSSNANLIQYYALLFDYHFKGGRPNPLLIQQAEEMIAVGAVGVEHYAHMNPSEFWAINGSRILAGRYDVHGSILGRMRQWLREFVQKVRSVLGLRSDAAVLRALDSLVAADGTFTSGVMLTDRPGVHFMYAGPKTLDQEAQNSLKTYRKMRAAKMSGEKIRLATGWFVSPLDGKLRYEFSDHDAEFTQRRPPERMEVASYSEVAKRYPLEEVLDHPTLFEHYPEAREITVTRQADGNDGERTTQGWFNEHTNTVNITPYAKNPLSVILHELQHWVQDKEGFASGSNVQDIAHAMTPEQRLKLFHEVMKEIEPEHGAEVAALEFMTKLRDWPQHDELAQASDDAIKVLELVARAEESGQGIVDAKVAKSRADAKVRHLRRQAAIDLTGKEMLPKATADELDFWLRSDKLQADKRMSDLMDRIGERDHQINELSAGIDSPETLAVLGAGTNAMWKAYRAAAGEIEARDTQFRHTLTPKERMDAPPLYIGKDIDRAMISGGKAKGRKGGRSASVEQSEPAQRYKSIATVTAAAVDRVPAGAPRAAVQTLGHMVRNSSKGLIRGLTFTRDLLNMAAKGLPSALRYGQLDEQRNARKIAHLHAADKIVSGHKALTVPERAAANAFIKRSTMEGKWGFKPLHMNPVDQANVKIDPALRDVFNALSKPAQENVRSVFAHGHATLRQMKTLVNSNVSKEFDAAIAAAAADPKEVARLEKDKADQLKHFSGLLNIGEFMPYAPLKRFGNHVVVGKSQAYLDAEAAQQANPDDGKLATALRDMQAQPAHYYVAMRETRHEAQMEAARIKDQYAQADAMEKDSGYLSEVGGNRGMLGMFHRLRGQANRDSDHLDKKARQASQRMLTDLYLSLLSEASARQSERERKNVAGAEEDMMRAFHSKARADANFLASLATGGDMQDALEAMEKEARRNGEVNGTTREERTDFYREILKRHVQDMDYKQSPKIDFALKTSSVFQLLTNPAYHLTNLLQPYVMSAPTMAGRFGMVRSMGALMTAHRELGARLFKNGVDHSSISDLPGDVQAGVQALMDKGLINMSLDSEHGEDWNDSKLGKPLRVLKRTSERIEAVNRVATGVAALRLAKGNGMSDAAAIDYAAKIIYDTHGDYSGFNAPSMLRSPMARLFTQYRKFQLIQISNYVRMFHDAFANADLTKEERWVARRALAYNLSTMFALGGTLALPGAQAIGAMLGGIFGDDDEPDNPELTMRKYLAEAGLEGVSDLLVKGVPAWMGVDVSGRLGAGTILSPFAYADTSHGIVSRQGVESYVQAAAGPFFGGLAPKLADGLKDVFHGDIYKGVENLMPNGMGSILKGARIATQGVTTKNGDVVMQPEEVGVLAGLAQGIGLPTTAITERKARSEALREMDLLYKGQVSETKRDYVRAYRDGDAAALAEAREEWAALAQRMKAHGFKPPKVSDLVKAPHEAKKREGMVVQGVAATKRNAGAARQLADLYD